MATVCPTLPHVNNVRLLFSCRAIPLRTNFRTRTTTLTFPPSPSGGVNGLCITSMGSLLLRLGALAVL